MLKRLQRIGKEAYKFQFTASYQDLLLEFANELQYDKILFLLHSHVIVIIVLSSDCIVVCYLLKSGTLIAMLELVFGHHLSSLGEH